MSSQFLAYGYAVTLFTLAPGYSLSLLVTPLAGEMSSTLKWFSGGSLEILQAGVTNNAGITTPVQGSLGFGYLLSVAEIVNTDGPARYYLAATGATAQAYCLKKLSAGF